MNCNFASNQANWQLGQLGFFSEGILNSIVGLLTHAVDYGHFDSVCSWGAFANPEQESCFTNIDKGIGQVGGVGDVIIVGIEN